MLLHAIHADKVFAEFGVKGRIIIKSPDTDVYSCVFTIFLSYNIHRSCGSKLVQFPELRTGGVISQYMRFVAPLIPFSPISYQLLML